MYRDMVYIREFETMLGQIKKEGAYAGIEYDHRGPAHLSIGQEAAVVGQCYHLLPEDFIFGSHRSHGEILAKSFSAIDVLDQNELISIMESYLDGMLLRTVETFTQGNIKDLAINYVLYGTLAEIFGRENGFNKGMGDRCMRFFLPLVLCLIMLLLVVPLTLPQGQLSLKGLIANPGLSSLISVTLPWDVVRFGKL